MKINPKILLLLFPLWVNASPWLETNDPYIRADLQLLADAGILDAPINHYPLRWATFGDDAKNNSTQANASLAQKHINYMLMSAKVQRGKKYSKAVIGNSPSSATGFGQTNKDEWGIYAGYENMFDDFSFRINSGYSKHSTDLGYEEDFVWNDSYLALNAGKFLFSVGAIDRWWGPSWQHNLTFANYGQSNPSISINYLGDKLPVVGYWSIETVVDFLESDFEYLSSTRLMIKPLRFLEFGATYQLTEKDDANKQLNQYGIDGRLSLPNFSNLYHGLFASFTSYDYDQQTSANIIGWDGQFNVYENSVRFVLEKQSVEDEMRFSSDKQRFQHAEINSLQWGDSLSLAFYLQFINDHKMSLIYRDSEGSSYYQEQSLQLDYRFPLTIGQFHLGLGQSDVTLRSSKNSETNFWSGYELRF